jgi:hypothetical protein
MYKVNEINVDGQVWLSRDEGGGQMWIDILWLAEDDNLQRMLRPRDKKMIAYWFKYYYAY